MKKKVLSALLSVCLFVGLAVPAFAAFPTSSVSGTDEEITDLVFAKESYTIPNGDPKDLKAELTAFAGKTKLVQEPTLEWSITDSLAFGIDDNGVVSNIGEDKGEATVTVKSTNGKTASVKVVAAKKSVTKATGYKFGATKYTLVNTTAEAQKIVISPTPAGSEFSAGQKDAISKAMASKTITADAKADGTVVATFGAYSATDPLNYAMDGKNMVFTLGVTGVTEKYNSLAIEIRLPKYDAIASDVNGNFTYSAEHAATLEGAAKNAYNNKFYASSKRATSVGIVAPVEANKVIRTGSIKIEVGQTADLSKYVAFGPTSSNIGKTLYWDLIPYDDTAEVVDNAVLDGSKVLGVAVGKTKATATLGESTVVVPIEVVERGAIPSVDNAEITPTTGAIKVGEVLTIEAKNVGDSEVSWSVNNGKLATVTMKGAKTTLKALAAGTVTVTAKVGDKVIGTATVTISAADASKPGASGNPQTGDSLFSNLF